MSTNKLFNILYQTHNDITKVTWPKSTTSDHDISKISIFFFELLINKCEIMGNGNKGRFTIKKKKTQRQIMESLHLNYTFISSNQHFMLYCLKKKKVDIVNF